jgi:hypothetical protein
MIWHSNIKTKIDGLSNSKKPKPNKLQTALLTRGFGLALLAFFIPISDKVGAVFAAPTDHASGVNSAQGEAGSSQGQPGFSEGSPGSADQDSTYLTELRLARKKSAGKGSSKEAIIGALTALGLHYNRKEEYSKAARTLNEALALTADSDYQNREQILPPLVEAEIGCKHLHPAEVHVKSLIGLARSNCIHQFPQLMFALNQYSRILAMSHREVEASRYKAEADKINSSIKGL